MRPPWSSNNNCKCWKRISCDLINDSNQLMAKCGFAPQDIQKWFIMRGSKSFSLCLFLCRIAGTPSCYLTLLIFFWKPKRGWWKTWSELILSSLNIIIAMTQKNGHIGRRLKRFILFKVLLKRKYKGKFNVTNIHFLLTSPFDKSEIMQEELIFSTRQKYRLATDHWLEEAMILLT